MLSFLFFSDSNSLAPHQGYINEVFECERNAESTIFDTPTPVRVGSSARG